MREILFRGKRVDNGEWVCGFVVKQFGAFKIYEDEQDKDFGNWINEVDPETIGQYTGLTDKNGTKIFTEDIVKYENNLENGIGLVECGDFMRVSVRWASQNTVFPTIYSGMSILCCPSEIEVIGNEHDNPELLESEKTNE